MNVMSLMKALERYSPFNDVSGRGGTLEIRDRPGDLAALGVIRVPCPIVNPTVEMDGEEITLLELSDGLTPFRVQVPCPAQEVVEMDYAEVEAKLAARHCAQDPFKEIEGKAGCFLPHPVDETLYTPDPDRPGYYIPLSDCPTEVQGPCPTHEPVDYEDIDAQLNEVCARLEELFDDYRRQLGLPVKDKSQGEG